MSDATRGSSGSPDEPRDPDDPREEAAPRPAPDESEDHPRGTLFLMLIFLMILVALWGYVYFDMIQGGS